MLIPHVLSKTTGTHLLILSYNMPPKVKQKGKQKVLNTWPQAEDLAEDPIEDFGEEPTVEGLVDDVEDVAVSKPTSAHTLFTINRSRSLGTSLQRSPPLKSRNIPEPASMRTSFSVSASRSCGT